MLGKPCFLGAIFWELWYTTISSLQSVIFMWKTIILYCIILLSLELHVFRIWIQYPLSFVDIGKGLMYVSCWKILTLFVTLYGFWCKPALTMVILFLHLKAMFPFSFLFFKFISVGPNCDSWWPESVKLLWFSKLKDSLLHC